MNSRKKNYYRPYPEKSGISPTSAVVISLVIGALAFAGGIRAERNGLINNLDSGSSSSSLPNDLNYDSVEQVYDTLRKNFDGDLNEQMVLDGLKEGLAGASGDPYTEYLTAEQAEQFNNDLNGTFSGIGAEIGVENEIITVVAPLEGFPAQEAGLRAQDSIIRIDDEETFGFSIEEAVLKIRGPEGSKVTLDVLRDGQPLQFEITRAAIKLPSVESEILEGNIGYLRISRFAEDTVNLVVAAAQDFQQSNVSGVILDLRNNSGGFLQSAVDVSSVWLDGLVVVEQREDGGETVTDTLSAGRGELLDGVPTIVLVNEGSASASEIVAGALSDHGKAQLVGQTSFGKGSVQSLEEVGGGGLLKVTIARWYTPNGRNIDKEGLVPDEIVEFTEADFENERDPQRERALELLKQ